MGFLKLIISLFLGCIFLNVANGSSTLFKNGKLIDLRSESIKDVDILVRDGKIEKIGSAILRKPEPYKIFDLEGGYILPGFFDAHGHAWGNYSPWEKGRIRDADPSQSAKLLLKAGILNSLDLFSDEKKVFNFRDNFSSHRDYPRIFAAGPIFTCTNGHGHEYSPVRARSIDSPDDAQREVNLLYKQYRPDVIKLVYDHQFSGHPTMPLPSMSKATMEMAIKTAKSLGLKTIVHIGTWEDAREAVEAGADAITHIYSGKITWDGSGSGKLSENGVIPDSLVDLMKRRNVYVIPTLAVLTEVLRITRNSFDFSSKFFQRFVGPSLIKEYQDQSRWRPAMGFFVNWQEAVEKSIAATMNKMFTSGLKILAGSDPGNFGTFQGYSLHREIELLQKYGMTNAEALRSASISVAEFMGQDIDVRDGQDADFIVLKKSPLKDIRNTQSLQYVVRKGAVHF